MEGHGKKHYEHRLRMAKQIFLAEGKTFKPTIKVSKTNARLNQHSTELVVNYTPMKVGTHAVWQMNKPKLTRESNFIVKKHHENRVRVASIYRFPQHKGELLGLL